MNYRPWVLETKLGPGVNRVARQIVQIAADGAGFVYALCNDGSVFYDSATQGTNGWAKLPPIPQPEQQP